MMSYTAYCALMLTLVCVSYFAIAQPFNSLSVLELTIEQRLNVTNSGVGLAIGAYSISAIPLSFLGGIFVDRIGVQIVLLSCASVSLVGTLVSVLATSDLMLSLPALATGRVLIALGGEPLYVCFDAIMVQLFSAASLPFAMGAYGCAGRAGDVFSYLVLPIIDFSVARWVSAVGGAALCLALCALMIAMIRRRHAQTQAAEDAADQETKELLDAGDSDAEGVSGDEEPQSFRGWLAEIRGLSWLFWIAVCISGLQYSTIYVFYLFAPAYLHGLYGLSQEDADRIVGVAVPVTAGVFTPVTGALLSRFGRLKGLVLICAAVALTAAFLLFGLTHNAVGMYAGVLLVGLSYGLTAGALWPCLADTADDNTVGFAFGTGACAANAGTLALTYAVSDLLDLKRGAFYVSVTLGCCSVATLLLCTTYAIGTARKNARKNAQQEIVAERREKRSLQLQRD